MTVTTPNGVEVNLTPSGSLRTDTTSGAHAEISAMNQALMAGNRGGDGELTVLGQNICSGCRNTNIRTMASALNLSNLTVNEVHSGNTYQFSANEFFSSKYGGITWAQGRQFN